MGKGMEGVDEGPTKKKKEGSGSGAEIASPVSPLARCPSPLQLRGGAAVAVMQNDRGRQVRGGRGACLGRWRGEKKEG